MHRSIPTTATFLLGSLSWAAHVVLEGPWAREAGAVIAADLVVLASVAVVGILVASARWGRRLALLLSAAGLALAVAADIGPLWWTGIALSGTSLALLSGNGLGDAVRRRPNAAGPPPRAVVLALGLAALPAVIAAGRPSGLSGWDWTAITAAAAAAVWYARALPAAPEIVRIGIPAVGLVALLSAGLPAGLLAVAACTVLAALAWTADARVAVRPLVESGRTVPVPAELAPPEILDAAGLDDRGRRRERP